MIEAWTTLIQNLKAMFILKKNGGIGVVFDTQNTLYATPCSIPLALGAALHHHIEETVYVFLRRYFPPDHLIFENFGESFYCVA